MSDYAAGIPGSAPEAPGETDLIPASVRRAQAIEDHTAARKARAAEKAREAREAEAPERAISAYMESAALRGETVSALDVINGNLGRTFEQITGGPSAELADRTPKEHREPTAGGAGSGSPAGCSTPTRP